MKSRLRGEATLLTIPAKTIRLGHALSNENSCTIFYDNRDFKDHKDRPWLDSYLKQRHNIASARDSEFQEKGAPVSISQTLLARHAILCGAKEQQ